jgi:hypothetical protein
MKQGLLIDGNGDKEWYLNGELHREDGPACEMNNGTKYWYLKGDLHRVNGPAIDRVNGTKAWFLNGKLHREDGPACEYVNDYKEWFLNDKLVYSKDKNNLHKFNNLSKPFKNSIIKYRLTL